MKEKEDFIFGIRTVLEAIRSGREIERVFMTKKPDSNLIAEEFFPVVRQYNIPFQYVPVEKLNRITRKNHQGVIAFISQISYSPLEEVITSVYESGKDPLFVVLDQVSDVRNFGAIARSVECLGFSGIIIPEKGAARINADAVKTSAGALLNIPVSRVKSLDKALVVLRESGLKVVSVSEKTENIIYAENLKGPLAIVLGSEESGIKHSILKESDSIVKIPMSGKIQSLNVSAAASIAIYEVVRQRTL